MDFLQQQDGTKHRQQKEIVEAQAEAQNRGKIATELLKGEHTARKSAMDNETKARVAGMKQNHSGAKIDPSTGRTFMNIPSPKRSIVPYKLPETGETAFLG